MTQLSDLFDERPDRWGLRGDPHLWDEMAERLGDQPLPRRVGDLRTVLEATFEALTGQPVSRRGAIAVRRYADPDGGMSTGMVSPEFWRDTGLPLLIARFRAALASGADGQPETARPPRDRS